MIQDLSFSGMYNFKNWLVSSKFQFLKDHSENFLKEECKKNDFMYLDANNIFSDQKYNKKWLFVIFSQKTTPMI